MGSLKLIYKPELSIYSLKPLMEKRNIYIGVYRYGYNGKENTEIANEGDYVDFGGRMLDVRVARWISKDPKAAKFPFESPYIYVSNNPLICIDPSGEEKIVISGGSDKSGQSDETKFLVSAMLQIRDYKKDIAKSINPKEKVTWLIMDLDYTAAEKKQVAAFGKKLGVTVIYVKSDNEVTNYINSKTTTSFLLDQARKDDQITSLSVMAHGIASAIGLGYENSGWDKNPSHGNPTVIGNADIKNIEGGAFANNAEIDLYTCNSATPDNMTAKDYPTKDALVKDALGGDNLVKSFSNRIPQASVTGYIGQSSYMDIGNSSLPKPGSMDGSYSPTVNGTHPPTIKVTMKNGKVQ